MRSSSLSSSSALYWIATLISNTLGTSTDDYLAHDNSGPGCRVHHQHGHHQRGATGTARRPLPHTDLRHPDFLGRLRAYRPLGANAGNTLSKAQDQGGLGIGTYGASAVLLGLLVICLCYQIFTRRRQTRVLAEAGSPQAM
jgi:hypothetical protein